MSRRRPIADGVYFTSPIPRYLCQFADKERVSEFLDREDALYSDQLWSTFGYADIEEYAFWAPRLCGLICLKMILDSTESGGESVAALTVEGVDRGGYQVRGSNGELLDKGWFYRPLVDMAKSRGFESGIIANQDIDDIARRIIGNQIVVASVNPRVIRGDEPPSLESKPGGHLVVIYGVEVVNGSPLHFHIHNPSGRTDTTQQARTKATLLAATFAGRGFYVTVSAPTL